MPIIIPFPGGVKEVDIRGGCPDFRGAGDISQKFAFSPLGADRNFGRGLCPGAAVDGRTIGGGGTN